MRTFNIFSILALLAAAFVAATADTCHGQPNTVILGRPTPNNKVIYEFQVNKPGTFELPANLKDKFTITMIKTDSLNEGSGGCVTVESGSIASGDVKLNVVQKPLHYYVRVYGILK